MRDYIIRRTGREGVFYQFMLHVLVQIKKAANLHNRLVRRHRIKQHYRSHARIKIHLGCGSDYLEGFLNTDLLGTIPVDITRRLPFPSDSVDLVYSDNLVEHVYNRQFGFHLKDVHRVLKDGGMYIIATPSLARLVGILFENRDPTQKLELLERHERKLRIRLDSATLLNRFMHVDYGHRFLYDFEAVDRLARESGYSAAEAIPNFDVPDKTIYESLRRKKGKNWSMVTETFVLTK